MGGVFGSNLQTPLPHLGSLFFKDGARPIWRNDNEMLPFRFCILQEPIHTNGFLDP